MWVPIFEKDDSRFFIRDWNYLADDQVEAMEIGLATGICEGTILGFRFAGEVAEIDISNCPHRPALLGAGDWESGLPVAIISGPFFPVLEGEAAS